MSSLMVPAALTQGLALAAELLLLLLEVVRW